MTMGDGADMLWFAMAITLVVSALVARDRVRDLIGFLDRIGRDRREVLREIPFAAAIGIAQLPHDAKQPVDGGCGGDGRV